MTDVLDFLPPFVETIDRIRARLNADANPGLVPGDIAFLDLAPGGFYYDLTQAPALETERLYESLNEALAAAFPQYAWGSFLDEHAVVVGLARKDSVAATGLVRFTGDDGTFVATGVQVATPQASPDADPLIYETIEPATIPVGGYVDVLVQATQRGSEHNVPAAQVTVLVSPVAGISAISNPAAISGGADIESDDNLRDRILLSWQGTHGGGTIDDYRQWALAYPGVGFVTVNPLWAGAGTVQVVITDINNDPVSTAVTDGLQAELDPVPGEGRGLAPIGHTVTVATPTTATVNVAATIKILTGSGYSLDGTSGTVALRADIEASIKDYIDKLGPGKSVILKEVIRQIMLVQGVYDSASETLGGVASNFAITSSQVAATGTISPTEVFV